MRIAVLGLALLSATVPTTPTPIAPPSPLMTEIRRQVQVRMDGWVNGRESPAAADRKFFFMEWHHTDDRMVVQCSEHKTSEDAIVGVRQLRMLISAGVPEPLPGVADEAYYLGPYGPKASWHTYFARRQFVCQAFSGAEVATRTITNIAVSAIDTVGAQRDKPSDSAEAGKQLIRRLCCIRGN